MNKIKDTYQVVFSELKGGVGKYDIDVDYDETSISLMFL